MYRTTRTTRGTRTDRITGTTRGTVALVALAAATALLAFAGGCSSETSGPKAPAPVPVATAYPVTVTDDASRSVTVEAEPQRIVSLAPANTEILYALGLGEKVVGVTSYDDYPAEVADVAKVGDFAGPNIEAIAAADPDVVFVTGGVQADLIAQLEGLGAVVISIDPQSLDGVYENIGEVAAVTNRSEQGAALVDSMQASVEDVVSLVAETEPVTAFVEIAQNPLFTAGKGTLIDELITLAGGKNVVTAEGWVPYSAEQVLKDDPAVYMATLGSMSDPAQLAQRPGFKSLSAVENDRVIILEDNLVSRPGPRIVEGLRLIAEGLHPEAFGQ